MSMFDLSGRTALITGSSRGIGKAIAEAVVAQGGNVVISSRKAEACEAVAAQINACHPGRAIAVAANISSKSDLADLVVQTRLIFKQIDILVCNAASSPYFGPMAGAGDDAFRKAFENNVLANHWLIQMVAPEMRARKKGSIIIVSSIGGMKGTKSLGVYNITKAADFQLARNLAVEFGPDNVRVNCIAPGIVRTDFAKALLEDTARIEAVTRKTPLQRIGEPEDIAGAALYLASDASRFVTGQSLIVDGGAMIAAEG